MAPHSHDTGTCDVCVEAVQLLVIEQEQEDAKRRLEATERPVEADGAPEGHNSPCGCWKCREGRPCIRGVSYGSVPGGTRGANAEMQAKIDKREATKEF